MEHITDLEKANFTLFGIMFLHFIRKNGILSIIGKLVG